MRIVSRLAVQALALTGAVALASACATGRRGQVEVLVTNLGAEAITDVRLEHGTQTRDFGIVVPGRSGVATFATEPKASILLDYYDSTGQFHSESVQLDLRPDWIPKVEFQIDYDGTVKAVSNIRID